MKGDNIATVKRECFIGQIKRIYKHRTKWCFLQLVLGKETTKLFNELKEKPEKTNEWVNTLNG